MKAVIITSQRSGSTFLAKCLDSHPQIQCYLEVFLKSDKYYNPVLKNDKYWDLETRRRPARFLHSFYARSEAPVMMFKLMYNQMIVDPRLAWYILANTDIRVLHLRRDNLLKQHVSNMLNKQRRQLGRPAHTTTAVPPASVYINPRQAVLKMWMIWSMFRVFDFLLRKHPYVELVYENVIHGRFLSSEATRKVAQLLDIDDAPMHSDLVKVNPDSLERTIQNYDDVVRTLRGTPFERFLD